MLRIVLSSHHLQGCRFLQHLQETLSNFRLIMLVFFLISNQNFLCCNLCLLLFVLYMCCQNSLSPPSLYHYILYIKRYLPSLPFPKAQPTNFFSVSSHGTCIRTLIILVIPSWINASSFRMFWQWGGQTRYSCSSTFSQILKQERESLLHNCLAISFLSSLHVADSPSIWNYQIPLCNVPSYPDST